MASINAGPVATAAPNVTTQTPSFQGCHSVSDELRGLPAGLPKQLDSPLAWTGQQFKDESTFVYHLTEADLTEVKTSLKTFKALELDGDLVNRENFSLPTLGPKLLKLSHDLYDGKGFCVIRGIKPGDYAVEDLTTVWLGIQSYIADQSGRQDDRGNMLVHIVADNSSQIKLGHHRHSTAGITFHNEESGDVVGWLTRSTAATGGKCIIASAYHIYNVLAATRPDMVRTLAKADWPFALPSFQCRPVIFYHDSKMIVNFGRAALLGNATHPRPEHLPKVNDRQREALDAVEAIAQATQMEIQTQAGDMHFINNLAVLHRREGFVNGPTIDEKRHLIRMRLRSSELGWAIPSEIAHEWDAAFKKDGGKTWHLEPMPTDAFPLRKYVN